MQSDPSLEKRLVFLIGPPRSGSTLLARMLGAHSAVCAPEEPHLITPLAHLGYFASVDAAPYDPVITRQAARALVAELPGGEDGLPGGAARLLGRDLPRPAHGRLGPRDPAARQDARLCAQPRFPGAPLPRRPLHRADPASARRLVLVRRLVLRRRRPRRPRPQPAARALCPGDRPLPARGPGRPPPRPLRRAGARPRRPCPGDGRFPRRRLRAGDGRLRIRGRRAAGVHARPGRPDDGRAGDPRHDAEPRQMGGGGDGPTRAGRPVPGDRGDGSSIPTSRPGATRAPRSSPSSPGSTSAASPPPALR